MAGVGGSRLSYRRNKMEGDLAAVVHRTQQNLPNSANHERAVLDKLFKAISGTSSSSVRGVVAESSSWAPGANKSSALSSSAFESQRESSPDGRSMSPLQSSQVSNDSLRASRYKELREKDDKIRILTGMHKSLSSTAKIEENKLKTEIELKNTQIRQLEDSVAYLKYKLDEYNHSPSFKQALTEEKRDRLLSQLTHQESENVSLKQRIASLSNDLDDTLHTADEERTAHATAVASLKDSMARMEKDLVYQKEKLDECESEKDRLAKENEDLVVKCLGMQKSIRDGEKDGVEEDAASLDRVQKAEQEKVLLEMLVEENKLAVTELTARNEHLKTSLCITRKECEDLRHRISKMIPASDREKSLQNEVTDMRNQAIIKDFEYRQLAQDFDIYKKAAEERERLFMEEAERTEALWADLQGRIGRLKEAGETTPIMDLELCRLREENSALKTENESLCNVVEALKEANVLKDRKSEATTKSPGKPHVSPSAERKVEFTSSASQTSPVDDKTASEEEKLQIELDNTQRELKESQALLVRLQKQLDAARKEMDTMRVVENEGGAELSILRNKCTRLEGEVKILEGENKTLNEDVTRLRREASDAKKTCSEEVAALEKKVGEMMEEKKESTRSGNNFQALLNELNTQLEETRDARDCAEKDLAEFKSRCASLEEEKSELQAEVESLGSSAQGLHGKIELQRDAFETELVEFKAKVARVGKKAVDGALRTSQLVSEIKSEFSSTSQDLRDVMESGLKEIVERFAPDTSGPDPLKTAIDGRDDALEKLRSTAGKLDVVERELALKSSDYEEASRQLAEMQGALATAEGEAKEKLAEEEGKVKVLQEEVDKLKKQVAYQEQFMTAAEERSKELEVQNKKLLHVDDSPVTATTQLESKGRLSPSVAAVVVPSDDPPQNKMSFDAFFSSQDDLGGGDDEGAEFDGKVSFGDTPKRTSAQPKKIVVPEKPKAEEKKKAFSFDNMDDFDADFGGGFDNEMKFDTAKKTTSQKPAPKKAGSFKFDDAAFDFMDKDSPFDF